VIGFCTHSLRRPFFLPFWSVPLWSCRFPFSFLTDDFPFLFIISDVSWACGHDPWLRGKGIQVRECSDGDEPVFYPSLGPFPPPRQPPPMTDLFSRPPLPSLSFFFFFFFFLFVRRLPVVAFLLPLEAVSTLLGLMTAFFLGLALGTHIVGPSSS